MVHYANTAIINTLHTPKLTLWCFTHHAKVHRTLPITPQQIAYKSFTADYINKIDVNRY